MRVMAGQRWLLCRPWLLLLALGALQSSRALLLLPSAVQARTPWPWLLWERLWC